MDKKNIFSFSLIRILFSFLIVTFFFFGCSINDSAQSQQELIKGTWQLETVTYFDSNNAIKYQYLLDTLEFQPLFSYHDVYRQSLLASFRECGFEELHTHIIEEFYTFEQDTISTVPHKIIFHNLNEFNWNPADSMLGVGVRIAPNKEHIIFDNDNCFKECEHAAGWQTEEEIMYIERVFKRLSKIPFDLRAKLF